MKSEGASHLYTKLPDTPSVENDRWEVESSNCNGYVLRRKYKRVNCNLIMFGLDEHFVLREPGLIVRSHHFLLKLYIMTTFGCYLELNIEKSHVTSNGCYIIELISLVTLDL